jgi:serine/threonine protein kinase
MEYLDGRPVQGPLPLKTALRQAIQIVDALDAAHTAGIVHRDLKPGNILIVRSEVKLLDFGLAKFREAPVFAAGTTATLPLTIEDTLAGTPQYMAPEQLERKKVDTRSDLFAFGCVLYEMLTGRPAFTGGSAASVIAAVLRTEPEPLPRHQPGIPVALARIVDRCLAKDPDQRWQTARDLKAELEWLDKEMFLDPPPAAQPRSTKRLFSTAALSALGIAISAMWVGAHYRGTEANPIAMRFVEPPPGGATYDNQSASVRVPQIGLSPDSRYLAFVAMKPSQPAMLWIRKIGESTATMLPNTEDATSPFWSPDSRNIGFFARGKLLRIDRNGGPVQQLADVTDSRGGTWGKNDVIVFASTSGGISQVSAEGGEVRPLTQLNLNDQEATHRWPFFLPDGKHVLYQVRGATDISRSVHVTSLDGKTSKKLVRSNGGALYSDGHLLYLDGSTLVAHTFDLKRLEITGEKKPIAERVGMSSTGYPSVTVATNNMLVYGEPVTESGQLTWHDRRGTQLGIVSDRADYLDFRLSPDQSTVVFARLDTQANQQDIWIADARGATSRFTSDQMTDASAQWSPDGRTIYFRSTRRGVSDIFRKPSGGGLEDIIFDGLPRQAAPVKRGGALITTDCTRDGRFLLYTTSLSETKGFDIWALSLDGSRTSTPQVETTFNEMHGNVSPNGRWLAYTTNESGSYQVNVRPFPATAASTSQLQVSTNGGSEPRWRSDGSELYYLDNEQRLMAAPVNTGGSFTAGVPKVLFATKAPKTVNPYRSRYDVSADGRRFLIFDTDASISIPASLYILVDWKKFLDR